MIAILFSIERRETKFCLSSLMAIEITFIIQFRKISFRFTTPYWYTAHWQLPPTFLSRKSPGRTSPLTFPGEPTQRCCFSSQSSSVRSSTSQPDHERHLSCSGFWEGKSNVCFGAFSLDLGVQWDLKNKLLLGLHGCEGKAEILNLSREPAKRASADYQLPTWVFKCFCPWIFCCYIPTVWQIIYDFK